MYICTKKLQERHVSLCDFYIAWLMTISEVRNMFSNPFTQRLTLALTDRLVKLKSSQVFQMALFMDPRLNYLNSKLFTDDEKLHIQVTFIQLGVTSYCRVSILMDFP